MNNILSVDLIGIALLAVALALVATPLVRSRKGDHSQPAPVVGSEGPVFLFDGDQLIDCNSAARAVLSRSATRGGDWQRLMAFLTLNFQGIDQRLGELAQRGSIAETAEIGNGKVMLLQAELTGGLTRISLDDPDIAEGPGVTLAIAHHALEREVQDLRQAVSSAPVVIWRESVQGDVIWANNAYMLLAASGIARGREMGWPLPRLFDRNTVLNADQKSRQSLTQDSDGTQKAMWYDLIVKQESAGVLCYALPIDAVVTAETNLRDFIDTLAKTFAQLPIGLAVFDKGRVLQMFNPALVELTTLPPDFLALKPSLLAVLDAMRDRNLLPEPKDYRSWRRQIVEMERAAASGLFQENWALPDGQTFRVTGRPYANGGLTLMIEDISSETQRSRRYRSDLEISQSVIDHLDDAIVVFDQSGHLMWCNAAYAQLWGHDPAANFGDATIRTVTTQWKTLSAPTQLWVEIDEFIHTVGIRQNWAQDLRLLDGRLITCAISPIAAGATMVAFKTAITAQPSKSVLAAKAARKVTTAA